MNHPLFARLLATATVCAFASLAQAQYLWINEKGVKEYSDRAPPPSIPLNHILKAPNGQPTASTPVAAQAADGAGATPTLADRNADYSKRLKDKAEQEKKSADARDAKAAQDENCARARAVLRSLDSGTRITVVDNNGERGYMSDEQRAAERKKMDKVLAACK